MHAPLVTLAITLLSTSAALASPPSAALTFSAMLRRGEAIAKRQGYYPSTDLCNGDGTTCAEICGSDTTECPSDGSMLMCHSTTDGSHCCTDGTGNACGPSDYCTHDASGQTYCCPENLNAEQCAQEFGLDVPLIPDSDTPTTTPSAVDTAQPTPTTTPDVPDDESVESTSAILETPSPSPSPEPSSEASSSKTLGAPTLPGISLPPLPTASSSKLPNVTSTSPSLPQFTGGAARAMGAGAVVLAAGAVGFVVL